MTPSRPSIVPAVVVILAGVSAALHVAKLFPALPVLRDVLQIGLLEAGFLLSAVQVAGMTLGLGIGLLAGGIGLKRCMLAGLLLLCIAAAVGGFSGSFTNSATALLAMRAVEGAGFLLVVTPAPALIRRSVAAQHLGVILGIWSSYIPFATALALLGGPVLIVLAGWPALWWALSALTLLMALCVWQWVPQDGGTLTDVGASTQGEKNGEKSRTAIHASLIGPAWTHRLRQTLGARGPWLVALSFGVYSGQWVAVIGFLPTIYRLAGYSGGATAWLTAIAAAVNILGNVASGWLLGRGVRPQALIYVGFCVMGLGAFMAFSELSVFNSTGLPADALATVRYAGVLLFSMVGGVIPGTLFAMAVRLAPGPDTVSTTVGWMQQWSACGQFVGPPVVAWVAGTVGGWSYTWAVTGACALAGLLLAWQLGQEASRVARNDASRKMTRELPETNKPSRHADIV